MPKVIRPFTTIRVKTLTGRIRQAVVTAVQGNKITARIGTKTKSQPITVIADPLRRGRFLEGSAGPTVTGGIVTELNGFKYHTFLASGDLVIEGGNLENAELLIVAGGGGGNSERYWGNWLSAGGGAGGVWNKSLYPNPTVTLSEGNCTVVVGAGAPSSWQSLLGGNSAIYTPTESFVAYGGSGGSDPYGWEPTKDGGSGGGNGGKALAGIAQGSNGGNGGGGSGGGASGVGHDTGYYGADGGQGTSAFSEWGLATGTGELVNGVYYYAGGGAGLGYPEPYQGRGGDGGGSGNQRNGSGPYPSGFAGLQNTGGGGNSRGAGGSGIVIIRYPIAA